MWLRIPTSHCLAATEDSTSPSVALCRRLAASVSWRGKLLRPQSWRLAWKTEGWRRRLSGLTLPPSQANSSVAAWLDSLVGFPAKTSALPADKRESRESGADCSLKSSDSFASWDRSSGCFLRTSRQSSIFQQEQPFSESLPKSGSLRNGELYERPMLVDRTSESGRLCWPTARSEDSESCGNHPGAVDSLTGAARMWMTPNLPLGGRKNTAEQVQAKGKTDNGKRQISLEGQTMHWRSYQTRLPNETSNEYWERMTAYETENGIDPAEGGMHWPTPRTITGGAESAERKQELGRTESGGSDLQSAAANWPTLATRDYRSPNAASHMDRSTGAKHLDQLPIFIEHSFLPAPPTSTHGDKSPSTSARRLNPDFVDWLMGLPPGWTDYAPLETASYLSKVRSLLHSFLGGHAK